MDGAGDVERATCVLLPDDILGDSESYDSSDYKEIEDGVRGFVDIEITKYDEVTIIGEISGLEPNSKHGFHIHELGSIDGDCLSTAGHYNPFDEDHGGPDDDKRHVGDLGNIQANDKGVAYIDIRDSLVKLSYLRKYIFFFFFM